MTDTHLSFKEEAGQLARQLFGDDIKKCAGFVDRLIDIYSRAQDKDFLLIHNPGGWGNTSLEPGQEWEQSIVEGIDTAVKKLGYSRVLMQYFRTSRGLRELARDAKEQTFFFVAKAKLMAAELRFITRHLDKLRVILIGVSQGAAFSNAVLQLSRELDRVYSIEIGTPLVVPFPYKSRRAITERTLAVDGNGIVPDVMTEQKLMTMVSTFATAPFRWVKYRIEGKPKKFTWCINVPGHDYHWKYPKVQRQILNFLEVNFGKRANVEVDRK